MPQIAKGGKYVFGWSTISASGRIVMPPEAYEEYHLGDESYVYLMPGSRTSGGFCVMPPLLASNSIILTSLFASEPRLRDRTIPEGELVPFKGRHYCWLTIMSGGALRLPRSTLAGFYMKAGDTLLSIRGSDIALGMASKGPLLQAARAYKGTIEMF